MPNATRIFFPTRDNRSWWEKYNEENPGRAWQRPSRRAPAAPSGRTYVVHNTPVDMGRGRMKHFRPLQAALMAFEEARDNGYTHIRVVTGDGKSLFAEPLAADRVYAVSDLIAQYRGSKISAGPDGTVKVENEGGDSPLAKRWRLTESGILSPTT